MKDDGNVKETEILVTIRNLGTYKNSSGYFHFRRPKVPSFYKILKTKKYQ